MICESCGIHAAAYWVDFTRRDQPVETFAVCWICMADSRRGPRPPGVTAMTGIA